VFQPSSTPFLTVPVCVTEVLCCSQVKAERPVWYLSVICGALLRVIEQVNLRSADYLGFLEKGQLPPARLTLTSFEQQLVLEGQPQYVTVLCILFTAYGYNFQQAALMSIAVLAGRPASS